MQNEAAGQSKTTRILPGLLMGSLVIMLLFTLSACCPPYCGERYGSDYYTTVSITTIPQGDGYVAQLGGEGFDNIVLDVDSSEFTTTCTGELEVTKNYAELIKQKPGDFKVVMRNNCSMAIMRSN